MKVTIIGGGSYSWSFGFVRQFVGSPHMQDIDLCLMDIDQEALDLVYAASEIYRDKQESTLRLHKTLDVDRALDGADFVLVCISTGGFDTMQHDLAVPEKFGIRHTVGDTVGPGGYVRAARNIPVFYSLAEKMKRLCPDAWMLNFTNPLSVLTRVPEKCFGIKTIGMCPGVEEQAREYARMAGFDESVPVNYTVTGIDHGSYFTSLSAGDQDIIAKLKDMGFCSSDIQGDFASNDPLMGDVTNRAVFAIWHELGYLPSISDRHAVENWPAFVGNIKAELKDEDLPFKIQRTYISDRRERHAKRKDQLLNYVKTKAEGENSGFGHGDDPAIDVVESLCGKRDFLWGSNYKNMGQIPGIPEGAVVETRCRFDAAGVHPLTSPMPDILKAAVLPHILRQEASIDIALEGNLNDFAALVSTDPLCSHLAPGQTKEMVSEMLQLTADYIPNKRLLVA